MREGTGCVVYLFGGVEDVPVADGGSLDAAGAAVQLSCDEAHFGLCCWSVVRRMAVWSGCAVRCDGRFWDERDVDRAKSLRWMYEMMDGVGRLTRRLEEI